MQIYINKNNQQAGPFEEAKVLEMLRHGQLSPNDFGFRQGASGWEALGTMFPNPIPSIQPVNLVNATNNPPKSKRGLMFGCLGLLLVGGVILSILVYFGYQRMNPTPTASEVPETIGKFKKEKVESSSGQLFGSNKGFVATYVSNENGKEIRMKYYFHSFSNNVLPMLWEDLKCTGKYENESRIAFASRQIGKTYYCNSETPFQETSFDRYVVTLAPQSKDVPPKTLEEMALSLIPEKGVQLVPFK